MHVQPEILFASAARLVDVGALLADQGEKNHTVREVVFWGAKDTPGLQVT